MKVHTLNIDSSQRQSNLYTNPNDYTVTLDNPIYDVSQIKLVSARIPTSQLLICETNQSFEYEQGGVTYGATIPSGNYTGTTLAATFNSNWNISYNATRNSFGMGSPVGGDITFKFKTGPGGYDDVNSTNTTIHQILGLPAEDISMPGTQFGAANFKGPNSLVLRISSGSEKMNQSVFVSEHYYTGHILLDGTDFINVMGSDDKVTHDFHSGSLKHIKDLRIEFFYMSHGRLIPYDFRNQDHVLKFEIKCSTDKLEGLTKVPLDKFLKKEKKKEKVKNLGSEILYNQEVYIYIGIIAFFGIVLMFLMKGGSKAPPVPPPT